LVKEYFESQERFVAATKKKEDNNSNGTGNKNSAHKKMRTQLRIAIIGVLIMMTITTGMNKNAKIP
jgi:hypothetical protein